jgi:hypothetical protein
MNNSELSKGAVVTVRFENAVSSNTYIVEADDGDTVLLHHPLFPEALIRRPKSELDLVAPNVKDSIERSLDFVNKNSKYLDYNTLADHEALSMYFVIRRKLTPRQKNILSNICGLIASIKMNNDVKAAMELVTANAAVLDEFNAMWFRNFSGLFSGRQPITSKKQRAAIFNIAGFVMAELERPVATNGYN